MSSLNHWNNVSAVTNSDRKIASAPNLGSRIKVF